MNLSSAAEIGVEAARFKDIDAGNIPAPGCYTPSSTDDTDPHAT